MEKTLVATGKTIDLAIEAALTQLGMDRDSVSVQVLAQAKSGDPFDTHNLPKAPFKLLRNVILALVIGVAAACFATGSMKKKLKSVVQKAQANDYVTPGSLQITKSRDFHLYTHLDRREKPKSGGGSSTHTSSSGTTHGGGGGKF